MADVNSKSSLVSAAADRANPLLSLADYNADVGAVAIAASDLDVDANFATLDSALDFNFARDPAVDPALGSD